MANRKRSGGSKGKLSRYLAPRIWAGGWVVAIGACVCVIFNLAYRHGVLAPEPAGKHVRSSVRPVYGVPSTAGAGEKASRPADKGGIDGAVAVVLVRNHPEAAVVEAVKPAPEEPAKLVVITLYEATKYHGSGSAIFVDARSAQRFEMGHVPGALNVPSSDFDAGYARSATRMPKDALIVVYCESSSCDQAEEVAGKLLQKGYRNLKHFRDGWLFWEFSDQVQERGAEK